MSRIAACFLGLVVAACCLRTHAAELPTLGEPEVVSSGHGFTEGPVLDSDHSVLFTDIPRSQILRYRPETGTTEEIDGDSGRSNGLDFDGDRLLRCEGGRRRVASASLAGPDGPGETVVLETFEGKAFNSPNDLIVLPAAAEKLSPSTGLFFTDPRYGNRDSMEMDVEGVYAVALPLTEQSVAVRVIDDLTRPNGITLSPDGRTLYVADEKERKIHAYDVIAAPGEAPRVSRPRVFADVAPLGNPDGLCTDSGGRLYVALARSGQLLILSPDGEPLALTPAGEKTSNVCVDEDRGFAYVTAGHELLRFAINTRRPANEAPLR